MDSLKEKTAKGLFWGGLNNGLQQVLNLVFGIFLARMLTAEDYGMVGMLTIFTLIASSLQESGFTAALANKKEVRQEDYNAVFWGSFLIALTLYALLFASTPLIAKFYGTPELTLLGRYVFLSFVFSSLGTAHSAYLFRNLKTKERAMANLIALALSGVVALVLAYKGFAYWGIATQSLVYIGTNTLLYWKYSAFRPNLRVNLKPLRAMFAFSSKLLLTNVFTHINNNFFSVILGKYYSEREVGYYNQANKWTFMAHIMITGMVSGIAQPVLAQSGDEMQRQQRMFRKMLRFTAFVSFPALFGFSLIAPEFIVIAITEKWLPSAEIMQVLCIGGAFIPIASLFSNLIVAKGKSDVYMWCTIALGVLQLLAVFISKSYGLMVMVTVFVLINILWLLVWHFFVRREIRLSLFHVLQDILPFAATATVAMLAAHFLCSGLENLYLSLICKILVAASTYFLIMWLSGSVIFKESLDFFAKKLKRQG